MESRNNVDPRLNKIMEDYIKKCCINVNEYKITDEFKKIFFLNESESNIDDGVAAFTEISKDVTKRLDELIYKELKLTKPIIDRRDIINRITVLIDLSKSIKRLFEYEYLLKEVVTSSTYDWRLMILDGVDYVSPFGEEIELLYPRLHKITGSRHLYKDIVVSSHLFNKEKFGVILSFIYVIRVLANHSKNLYGNYLNLTDIVLREYITQVFNKNTYEKFKSIYALV